MKYFLDCEFIEDGKTIDLISIGIVAEDGREYYAVNSQCDFSKASDWVLANVLKPIGLDRRGFFAFPGNPDVSVIYKSSYALKSTPEIIVRHVLNFCHSDPEFWGEWPAYDWVVFCQLFGSMSELPQWFPMRCNDVIQFAEHMEYISDDLPSSLETDGYHNALLGAKTVQKRYEWLMAKANE